MDEITVYNQQEMDAVPDNYNGKIIIEGKDVVVVGYRIVELYGESTAMLYDNASAKLHDNATAYLHDNATAELYDNTTAKLYGNSQVLDKSDSHRIKLHGNSRVVYLPQNINEYLDYYGIKHTKNMVTLYKAVRKTDDGKYVSNHNATFEYVIGKYKTEKCDTDITQACSCGIHIAPLDWVLRYGEEWDDLAILEVETNIDDIILPENTNGKVRTSKVKVIREVPLEECGILGKMIVRKQRKES